MHMPRGTLPWGKICFSIFALCNLMFFLFLYKVYSFLEVRPEKKRFSVRFLKDNVENSVEIVNNFLILFFSPELMLICPSLFRVVLFNLYSPVRDFFELFT